MFISDFFGGNMALNKKKVILFIFIGIIAVCICYKFIIWKSSPYIKSDRIVYKTDSIEVPHVATKEFDGEGKLHLLAQLGIGRVDRTESEKDSVVVKTSVDTGKSLELYDQKADDWDYKSDGWFRNYACFGDAALCADFVSEELTYGKPTTCLAVIDLDTKQKLLWNLSKLSGKAVFSEEGEQVNCLVWLNREQVALLSENTIMCVDIKNGKLLKHSRITDEPFVNWNVSGTVLSYVVMRNGNYIFEALDLASMKKLASIDAGQWKPGFGEDDMLYCDGTVYKIDKKSLYRYSFEEKKFQKIYSGIKMQETSVDPETGEKYYNYCRLYGVKKDCLYVMHTSEYAGECSFCQIHKLEL